MAPPILPAMTDLPNDGNVFEGPEKKLEIFFSASSHADGFRRFDQGTWSDLLVAASCSILHLQSNEHFDAYLLSESSLFVYPTRVILKTCGTTCLLLVLPKLLELAKSLDVIVEHVHYGHYRYKFPEQQLYPHTSFEEERIYLSRFFDSVEHRVLGPNDGCCWYALCSQHKPAAPPLAIAPRLGDDLFEIAMEGLPEAICKQFVACTHSGLSGRALAQKMTISSGIGALLSDATIDDWAFEPCGYSMNGLRGAYYYTIHITPELDFSYASFETNDPAFRQPALVQAIVALFQPSVATMTLTTKGYQHELPSYILEDYGVNSRDVASLGTGVSMCCTNFIAAGPIVRKRKLLPIASPVGSSDWGSESVVSEEVEGGSGSDGSSFNGE